MVVENMCQRSGDVIFVRTWSSIILKLEIVLFGYCEKGEENKCLVIWKPRVSRALVILKRACERVHMQSKGVTCVSI